MKQILLFLAFLLLLTISAKADGCTPPTAPTLISPATNSTGHNNPDTLIWAHVTGVDTFHVQLDDDIAFGSTLADAKTTDTFYICPTMATAVIYYWRALGIDATCIGAYSSSFNFRMAGTVVTAKSFSITSAAVAGIANTELSNTTETGNFGAMNVFNIGKSTADRRAVLRFENLKDSLRVYINADTGSWVLDSGRTIITCSTTPGTNDSMIIGLIRLKSGRAFTEGVSSGSAGTAGARYDSCTAAVAAGYTKIGWTTAGGAGSDDTTGGIIDSFYWAGTNPGWLLGPAAPAANGTVSAKIRTADLADTSTDSYPGWLIWPIRYGAGGSSTATQRIIFNSDDASTAGYRPSITVYLTNTKQLGTWSPPAGGTTPKGRRRQLQQGFGVIDKTNTFCRYEESEL